MCGEGGRTGRAAKPGWVRVVGLAGWGWIDVCRHSWVLCRFTVFPEGEQQNLNRCEGGVKEAGGEAWVGSRRTMGLRFEIFNRWVGNDQCSDSVG